MTQKIIVYGHPTCPMLPPVIGMLKRSKVDYIYINIHQDNDARQRVRDINNGNESVPTLVFPDGSTLTEPGVGQLKRKLQSVGYSVPLSAWLAGNAFNLLLLAVIVYAGLRLLGVL